MNGIEIIRAVLDKILLNSFANYTSRSFVKGSEAAEDEQPVIQSSQLKDPMNKIQIDRVEAKTLSLCIKSFNALLYKDIQSFVDFPLEQRITLFEKVSRILDLNLELLPLFENRVFNKEQQESQFDSKNYSESMRHQGNKKARHNKKRHSKNKQLRTHSKNVIKQTKPNERESAKKQDKKKEGGKSNKQKRSEGV